MFHLPALGVTEHFFCVTDFSKFCSKTKNSAGEMPATETRLSEILRQILSRTYSGLQLNVDKTLLGPLFTSFVGRREFALSVVETTCLEETLFKVVRACMRKTVLRMIL